MSDRDESIRVFRYSMDYHNQYEITTVINHHDTERDVWWIRTLILTESTMPQIVDASDHAGVILDLPVNTDGHRGVRIHGTGQDVARDLIGRLSRAIGDGWIFGEGFTVHHNEL